MVAIIGAGQPAQLSWRIQPCTGYENSVGGIQAAAEHVPNWATTGACRCRMTVSTDQNTLKHSGVELPAALADYANRLLLGTGLDAADAVDGSGDE